MNGILDGLIVVKGYIPWVGQVERKRARGKFGIVVGECQWLVGLSEL
jgi:hypothetical protein